MGLLLKKLYCWFIALSMIGEIWLGGYMVGLTFYDRWYHDSLMLHKSIGMIILLPALIKIMGTVFSRTPGNLSFTFSMKPLLYGPRHVILYLLIAVTCMTGYTISTSEGAGISIFGLFDISSTYPVSKEFRDLAITCHYYLAYGAAIFITAHALMGQKHRRAALKRKLQLM